MIPKWIFEDKFKTTTIGELINNHGLKTDILLGNYINYTPDQLLQHYDVELDLAKKLRTSKQYTGLYDELFKRVPFHPQIQRKTIINPDRIQSQYNNIKKLYFFSKDTTYMEIGAGDCLLTLEVAKDVKQVFAIDVSTEITKNLDTPDNFTLFISDGNSIPAPPNSVDIAYSNQLMEHLHPDDAAKQLKNIVTALKPGGIYVCSTPHRYGGPADVSRFFDEVATGFHLKEYNNAELYKLFKQAGFSKVYKRSPIMLSLITELFIEHLPYTLRRKLYKKLKRLLGLNVIGRK